MPNHLLSIHYKATEIYETLFKSEDLYIVSLLAVIHTNMHNMKIHTHKYIHKPCIRTFSLITFNKFNHFCFIYPGKTSSWKTMNADVPQGSVLGPLLFLIYINDISMHLSSRASLFADDTSLSKHISDYDTDNGELQNDLDIIENWAKQWKVKFNPLKSDALLISRRLKGQVS